MDKKEILENYYRNKIEEILNKANRSIELMIYLDKKMLTLHATWKWCVYKNYKKIGWYGLFTKEEMMKQLNISETRYEQIIRSVEKKLNQPQRRNEIIRRYEEIMKKQKILD